jgi:NADPH:quinone reductase-like Zn-dependent oxidoreductase
MSFEAAACIPCAGITALQSLRDKTKRQPGQRILINGASGGVGTFAVQIAKSYGAIVTGVCGPTSGELVRSLGADFTIDYTEDDFAKTSQPFDIVLDVAGNRTLKALRTAAGDHGVVVLSAGDKGKWIAPMKLAAGAVLEDRFVSQELHNVLANVNRADLEVLAAMFEAGTLKPVIERTYPLVDAASAIETVEAGHVHGKLVVTVKTP